MTTGIARNKTLASNAGRSISQCRRTCSRILERSRRTYPHLCIHLPVQQRTVLIIGNCGLGIGPSAIHWSFYVSHWTFTGHSLDIPMSTSTSRLTVEEFLALPEDPNVRRELILGELREETVTTRNPRHAGCVTKLATALENWRNASNTQHV